jgi:hypothetical protein
MLGLNTSQDPSLVHYEVCKYIKIVTAKDGNP